MKSLIFIVFILIPIISIAQKRITIKDPEIEFSLEIPKRWQKHDNGYYYYLIPPSPYNDEHLSITYVESDTTNLSYMFEFTINDFYRLNEANYKLLDNGNDTVGLTLAKWAIFESKVNSIEYKSLLYFFKQNGQIFKLRGTARKENYDKYEKRYISIIKSIESKKI